MGQTVADGVIEAERGNDGHIALSRLVVILFENVADVMLFAGGIDIVNACVECGAHQSRPASISGRAIHQHVAAIQRPLERRRVVDRRYDGWARQTRRRKTRERRLIAPNEDCSCSSAIEPGSHKASKRPGRAVHTNHESR
jgi:hypothetical protein